MSIVPMGPMGPPPRFDPDMALHTAIARYVAAGYRVESMTNRSAMLATGSPCNHTLHALITFLFSCGLWAPVWIMLAVTQKVHRVTITVDERGRVFYAQGEATR